MAKRSKSGKKAISAGDGEYRPPVKKILKTPKQAAKRTQQLIDAKKRYNERFKQMEKNDPELLERRKKDAERKQKKRAEIKDCMSSEKPFFISMAQQAIYDRGYKQALKDMTAREDTVKAKEATLELKSIKLDAKETA